MTRKSTHLYEPAIIIEESTQPVGSSIKKCQQLEIAIKPRKYVGILRKQRNQKAIQTPVLTARSCPTISTFSDTIKIHTTHQKKDSVKNKRTAKVVGVLEQIFSVNA